MFLRFLLVMALLAAPALADDVTVKLRGIQKGKSYEVKYNQDGSITMLEIREVSVGGGSPPTNPPPTDPDEPADKELIENIRLLTVKALDQGGTKTTGAALSSVYSLVSKGVRNETIKPAQVRDKISDTIDAVMTFQADHRAWEQWRTWVSEMLATGEQRGSLQTADDWADVCELISQGLDKATGFNAATAEELVKLKGNREAQLAYDTDGKADGILDGINLDQIIRLIELIMRLLEMWPK